MDVLFYNDRSEFLWNIDMGRMLLECLGTKGKVVKEYLDLLYNCCYTDFEPDIIIINSDMGINSDESQWQKRLSKAKCFPVELGELCKEICKEKGKKEPKIVILTTFKKRVEKFSKEEIAVVDLTKENCLSELYGYVNNVRKI